MGVFDNIRKAIVGGSKPEERSLAFPDASDFALFGAVPTQAGISVGPDSAQRSPTALACMRAITESIASLPIELFEKDADGSTKLVTNHWLADLLGGDWCPWTGGFETRAAMMMDALQHGAGYAKAVRVNGEVRELHRLEPTSVAVEYTRAGEPQYRVTLASGGQEVYPWSDIVMIATPGWAPCYSLSPQRPPSLVSLCREAIALDVQMAAHQSRIFAKGARPSGVIEAPPTPAGTPQLSERTIQKLVARLNAQHAGGNSGGTIVLEEGMTFRQLEFSSVDMQFLELRNLVRAEIAAGFRVPQTIVGDLQRAVWRNVEELGRQFLQFSLRPWIRVWEGALSRVCLTPEERKRYVIEFDDDELLRADMGALFTALRNAVGGSFLTPDEGRARINLPPTEGGDKLVKQAGQTSGVIRTPGNNVNDNSGDGGGDYGAAA